MIREYKPKSIIKISPCGGWSTAWILNALKDNGFGQLYSYDLINLSTKTLPENLTKDRWVFTQGDIKTNMNKLPENIDYLFIDSDHSGEFATWFINNLFPKLEKGTPVSVHDVFHTTDPNHSGGESKIVIEWLKEKGIDYFTASKNKENLSFLKIKAIKRELNIHKPVHFRERNSTIYFNL